MYNVNFCFLSNMNVCFQCIMWTRGLQTMWGSGSITCRCLSTATLSSVTRSAARSSLRLRKLTFRYTRWHQKCRILWLTFKVILVVVKEIHFLSMKQALIFTQKLHLSKLALRKSKKTVLVSQPGPEFFVACLYSWTCWHLVKPPNIFRYVVGTFNW